MKICKQMEFVRGQNIQQTYEILVTVSVKF